MKTKLLCMLYVTVYAVTTLLICASCENPWMREILEFKTITFDSNGGSHVSSQDLIKGKKVTRPANPSRSGFAFDAWYIDNGTFEKPWNFNIVPTYGFTLYAKWNLSGEYAAGTAGLAYELIESGTNAGTYRVSKGSVTGGAVHIPAMYRPNPDSPYLPVTSIENVAFANCSITSITIPNSVTSIGSYAFEACTSLTGITIPNSVTSIGDYAFSYCPSLDGVTIGEGVTSIGEYAFEDCTSLTGITIPANVTSIGQNAFIGCTNLKNIIIDTDKVANTQTDNWLTRFPATGLSVTFRKNVGNYAFYANANDRPRLTSVTIAEGVTSIGDTAFSNCTGLTSITLPAGLKSIGEEAFSFCTSLISITIPASLTEIKGNVFEGCTGLTSVTLPNGLTFIGTSMFAACTSLASITIPASVTFIGGGAFYQCNSLTSITLPYGLTSIEEETFCGTGLTSITIPASVTSIGTGAFYQCNSLTSITIPVGVTSINGNAFGECTGLTSVNFQGTINAGTGWTYTNSNAFLGDLRERFFANSVNGAPGTYTTTAPVSATSVWTKQP